MPSTEFNSSIKHMQQEAQDKILEASALGMSSSDVPNPGISIVFFLIVTTVLLILKIVLLPSGSLNEFETGNPTSTIVYIIYIFLLFAGNYMINISITSQLCSGTPQWGTTFIVTFLPWILIFGIINIVLIIFPGWLIPFSNTFGYFVVGFFGLKQLFDSKIISRDAANRNVSSETINRDIDVARALQKIYGNESLLINEIPRDGSSEQERVTSFNSFFKTMIQLKIFKSDNNEDAKVKLYRLLKIKDFVAEYVWYILAGLLVSSITYNYIVIVGCDINSKQMSDAYKQYEQQESKKSIGLTKTQQDNILDGSE